ncbi:MAG: YceI family protein [Cyclobacteriaceae bacterium]
MSRFIWLIPAILIFQGCGSPGENYVPGGASNLDSLKVKLPVEINMGNRYQIDKDGSYIIFETTIGGFPAIRGSVKSYQATMFYDPENIKNTSATLRIASEGFTSAHDKRDVELQGGNFLNTARFPAIWFQGSKVKITENGFDLTGNLNIKDIIRSVTIQVKKPSVMRSAKNNLDMMMVKGSFTLNRNDFGLGIEGDWAADPMFGEDIKIDFNFMGVSYTIDYLKANFVHKAEGKEHAIGLVYNELKTNGLESSLKLMQTLRKSDRYKSEDWLKHLADIGWILLVDELGKESLTFFEIALEEDPNHLTSLLRMGDAYVVAGDYERALAHYREEWKLPARSTFTHLPHMLNAISGAFELKNMQ